MILSKLETAYGMTTMNTNYFRPVLYSLMKSIQKEGANLHFEFADGSSLDTDNLDPFKMTYATFVSADLSLVKEIKAC